MGRDNRHSTTKLAMAFVSLRSVNPEDPTALRTAVGEAAGELEEVLAEQRPHYSKAEAAQLLEVSPPTLEHWVSSKLLPVERVRGYKRERVPARPLLRLATEVKELRRRGRQRGLLVEALSRIEQNDPEWRAEFERLYGEELGRPWSREDYVSAAPGADWDPED